MAIELIKVLENIYSEERERERERKRERKREATISYDCHVVAKKAYRGSEKMGNTLCDEI